ncbi:hypothetical protein IBE20_07710 [Francisella tularensis subsp. novicida]|uniref:Uncharacterized protein n=2 Tax=Francisella tularensis TaxID=263 RepID=A0A6I4RPJ2_FRATU|nr:hypothetical protein [Francisella tularensis]ABK89562.1 protein of unknown function [Francisella tularensis subsp. novicida U112]AJI60433.1 hypothetical protein AW25_1356 [Francisella tularensis subsp. novicida U112]EDX19903.1 hypothetical protein FTE_1728 [Francisella tularensis subsp. novicida FTE]MBK2035462.1 hypothetical protein [Francisella tularensis subsp. novicida]MBK2116156.1 hypothetical protein [Francisella tularensis subsp. novicida]
MTIKIFPEKVANIPTHTTRKKITNTTYASKQLISKAAHLKTAIEVANKELYKLDLPYLRDTQIVFYSPTKIIVHSNKEILKSKLKELHDQFVTQLKQNTLFSKLEKIEIIIDYTQNNNKTNSSVNNETAKQALDKIKKQLCRDLNKEID